MFFFLLFIPVQVVEVFAYANALQGAQHIPAILLFLL